MLGGTQGPHLVSTNTMLTMGRGLFLLHNYDRLLLSLPSLISPRQQGKEEIWPSSSLTRLKIQAFCSVFVSGDEAIVFFYDVWLEWSSYCLNVLSCQAASFLVFWLEITGFSWDPFCLHPLAFPDFFWLLQYLVWGICSKINKNTQTVYHSVFSSIPRYLASLLSSLYLSIFLCLFYTQCPGSNKEKYTYSFFLKAEVHIMLFLKNVPVIKFKECQQQRLFICCSISFIPCLYFLEAVSFIHSVITFHSTSKPHYLFYTLLTIILSKAQ